MFWFSLELEKSNAFEVLDDDAGGYFA